MDLQEIMHQENTTIIDVREPFEYAPTHAEGAVNIPLGSIHQQVDKIKKMGVPIIVYCRSGMRSANALQFLLRQGVKEIYNAGSLDNVVFYQKK